MGFLRRRSKGSEGGAHDRAHAMIAHLQVLIATSEEVAIPGYLQDKDTGDIEAAVGVCDNLLKGSEGSTSIYNVATVQAREAFVREIGRRRMVG